MTGSKPSDNCGKHAAADDQSVRASKNLIGQLPSRWERAHEFAADIHTKLLTSTPAVDEAKDLLEFLDTWEAVLTRGCALRAATIKAEGWTDPLPVAPNHLPTA